MDHVDQIAAVKATLELVIMDSAELVEQFREVMDKLESIESLPPGIRRVQFRQLEQSGAFKFRGADIRSFAKTIARPLTPRQFVARTNRRLTNTTALIDAFIEHEDFEGGAALKASIEELLGKELDVEDGKAVRAFRKEVQQLRETGLFGGYMMVRDNYLGSNSELKDEADYLATKETVEDGMMLAEGKADALQAIQSDMAEGLISVDEAQEKLAALGEGGQLEGGESEDAAPGESGADASEEAGGIEEEEGAADDDDASLFDDLAAAVGDSGEPTDDTPDADTP